MMEPGSSVKRQACNLSFFILIVFCLILDFFENSNFAYVFGYTAKQSSLLLLLVAYLCLVGQSTFFFIYLFANFGGVELYKIEFEEQKEWYFFSHKDKKYPTETCTNRATKARFWTATRRDKAVYSRHY
jgi:hypothetical protein